MNKPSSKAIPYSRLSILVFLAFSLFAATAPAQETEISEAMAVQVLLSRVDFSPAVIDGLWGSNTRGALRAFQRENGLEATGELDQATRDALDFDQGGKIVDYTLSEDDVAGPFVEEIPDDMMKQAELDRLGYTSPAEALAEKFHLSEELLHSLNPGVELEAGATIRVPDLGGSEAAGGGPDDGEPHGAVRVIVSKSTSSLEIRDDQDELVFYAPVTAGSDKDPLPIGEWKVRAIAAEPTYHYNPELFWDSDPDHAEASLPPGPNNPVGTVWIDLDKEHYGIHGTPEPSTIGHTESHGCVRLTNWDADRVARAVSAGTDVIFKE